MNWTGGRLQRHSRNAAKGVMGRQKAHFAKLRTQLQNGPTEHSVPFKPDYFDQDGDSQGRQLASFAGGNTLRDSRSQTLHGREKARARDQAHHLRREKQSDQPDATHHLTDATGPSGESAASASFLAAVPRPTQQNQALVCDTSRPPQNRPREDYRIAATGNRMPANPDTADEAWEDNKRRLLDRPDWVGLAPSRPVKMHFPLRRDKDRIGKRRKIDNHVVAQLASNDRIMRQHFPHSNAKRPSPFLNGAVVNNVENISVRIGTDALTNHTVDQIVQPAQGGRESLSGSSDSMLFDHPAEILQQTPSASANHIHACAPAAVPELHQFSRISNSRPPSAQWHAIDSKQTYHLLDADSSPKVSNAHDTASHYRDRGSSTGEHNEATAAVLKEPVNSHGCSFHITQRLGGPRPPYRFVSEEPSDCSAKGVHDALQGTGMGSFHKSNTTSSAFVPWENRVRGVPGDSRIRELPGKGAAIDDDAPWKEFLAIAGDDSSSHSTTSGWRGPGLSRQQLLHISDMERRFSPRANSEWDTLDAQPRKIPALQTTPCDSRSDHSTSSAHPLHHLSNLDSRSRNVSGNKAVDQEELWKRFVFGDCSPAFDAAAHNDCRGQGRPSTPAQVQDRSRLRLASFLAAGGVSSANSMLLLPTSSKLVSPHFSCVSDDVQNARGQMKEAAPFPAKVRAAQTHNNNIFPWISSSVFGNASRLDSGDGDSSMITPAEHVGGHAEQLVTHAFLENNAFSTSDVSSVRTNSPAADPMMFHGGLDRNDEAGEKQSWPRLLKRRESLPQVASSMKGIPDSDELDLIDPDRIK